MTSDSDVIKFRKDAMKKRTIVVALVVLGLTLQSSAPSAQLKIFVVYGPADVSCGQFTSALGTRRATYEWWALGFLSGVGWTRAGEVRLKDTDSEGAIAWVAKYCAEHPLDMVVDAAKSLVAELEPKPKANEVLGPKEFADQRHQGSRTSTKGWSDSPRRNARPPH